MICSCIQVELPSIHELFVAKRTVHSPKVKTGVAMRYRFEPCVVYSLTAAGLRPALCTHHRVSWTVDSVADSCFCLNNNQVSTWWNADWHAPRLVMFPTLHGRSQPNLFTLLSNRYFSWGSWPLPIDVYGASLSLGYCFHSNSYTHASDRYSIRVTSVFW